ncbi:MAG TPA: ACT domain-containing protein [Cyclobacteriaceae bacterium]
MAGETDLATLLRSMKPILNEGEYVFCTLTDSSHVDLRNVIGSFMEVEGLTVILNKHRANEAKLSYSFTASWITLTVHSSLEAVGLTAAFSNALAEEGISCNVIAAFYHDHIFVATKDKERAMTALKRLSENS